MSDGITGLPLMSINTMEYNGGEWGVSVKVRMGKNKLRTHLTGFSNEVNAREAAQAWALRAISQFTTFVINRLAPAAQKCVDRAEAASEGRGY